MKGLSLSVVLMVALSAAACGAKTDNASKAQPAASEKASNKQVTLKFWHHWPTDVSPQRKPLLKVVDDYQKKNPNVKFEIDAVETEAFKTKVKLAVAANDAPDILHGWGGGFMQPLVASGKMLALDDYLKDGTADKLLKGTLTYMTQDNKVYALPYEMNIGVLYCNTELFEKNGVKIPETYKELLSAVEAFRAKNIVPLTAGGKDRWPTMFYYDVLALRAGGEKLSNDALAGKESYDRPEFVLAGKKLQELAKAKAFDNNVLALSRDESEATFIQGKVPMYFNFSSSVGKFEKDGVPIKGKLVAKKFPILEDGKNNTDEFLGGTIDCFMATSGNNNDAKAEAVKYISKSLADELYKNNIGLSAWKTDGIEKSTTNTSPLLTQINELVKSPTGFVIWWDTYLAGNDSETHKNLVQELIAGSKTPEQFTKEMQKLNDNRKK